ncbi:MAG: SAM-dependent methyltransferase, partial [Tunicatimonas sp.]
MSESAHKGTIYLIPTIIAPDTQHSVLPRQIIEVVNHLTYFLVENVRTTRRFLSSLSIQTPISELQFELLSKKTLAEDLPSLIEPALSGMDIGIM